MHDLPDTDDADASAERFWPEGYKDIIRTDLKRSFADMVVSAGAFRSLYESLYQDRFDNYDDFVDRLAEMVVIGAENGIDLVLGEVYDAFRENSPFPDKRYYAKYYWPEAFTEELKKRLGSKAFEEFDNHHAYVHIHEDHYESNLSFDEFITGIADLVVMGAVNGADDALGNIYRAFISRAPLPTARRRPRTLR
jgi:hypothetical protein